MIWRSQIYQVDLGVPVRHELARVRPGLVVSADLINNGAGQLVGIVPITSRHYGLRSHIELEPGLTGLDHVSFARCDQVRMVSAGRLRTLVGQAPSDSMDAIYQALRNTLDL
ncbi:MAG: type II toxin-antitoxin system PemK/MazF family toxin [Acidimicrobiales bacterium]